MPIAAVIFDAFGTVVQIGRKRHPYRQLLRIGALQGRRPSAADLPRLMTSSLDLDAAAETFGICVSPAQMTSLQHDLEEELDFHHCVSRRNRRASVAQGRGDSYRYLLELGRALRPCSSSAPQRGRWLCLELRGRRDETAPRHLLRYLSSAWSQSNAGHAAIRRACCDDW